MFISARPELSATAPDLVHQVNAIIVHQENGVLMVPFREIAMPVLFVMEAVHRLRLS